MPRRAPRRRASQEASDAPEAPPPSYLELCDAARARLLDGDAGAAEAAARGALALLPRGLEAQRLLGLALLERGDARPALHALAGALAADPLDLCAQTGVAEARELLDGAAGAEAEWRRAWELDPGHPQIEARLQAARQAAGALDGAGTPPLTRTALARIYLRGGLLEHAATEARTLLAREPDRPDLQLLLAEAFWKLGDTEAAAAVGGALLERLPDCAMANLLVAAHWHAVGRDIAGPMARVRAVDPAGTVADRLFDDRDAPPLLEAEAAAAPYQRPPAPETVFAAAVETEAVAAGVEDTQPLPVVALPESVEVVQAAEPVEVAEPIEEVASPERLETVERVEPPEEVTPATPEEPAAPASLAPSAAPSEAIAPPVVDGAAAARQRGDLAMREARYVDATRAYGEALRALRQAP